MYHYKYIVMGCGIHKDKHENQDTNQKLIDSNTRRIYLQRQMVNAKTNEERHKMFEKKIFQAPILSLFKNSLYKSRLMMQSKIMPSQ